MCFSSTSFQECLNEFQASFRRKESVRFRNGQKRSCNYNQESLERELRQQMTMEDSVGLGAAKMLEVSKTEAQVTNQSTPSSHVTQYSSLIGSGAGGLQDAGPLLRQARGAQDGAERGVAGGSGQGQEVEVSCDWLTAATILSSDWSGWRR